MSSRKRTELMFQVAKVKAMLFRFPFIICASCGAHFGGDQPY
jgi:hypothetical protein